MKGNRIIVLGIILSVFMSAAALALQVKSESPFWGRFFRPLQSSQITEADYRGLRANLKMLSEFVPMRNGIGSPFIDGYSDDRNKIIVSVPVSSESFPTGFEDRKKEFWNVLLSVHGDILTTFFSEEFANRGLRSLPNANYEIKFVDGKRLTQALYGKSMEEMNKILKGNDAGIVAVYRDGQLTMR